MWLRGSTKSLGKPLNVHSEKRLDVMQRIIIQSASSGNSAWNFSRTSPETPATMCSRAVADTEYLKNFGHDFQWGRTENCLIRSPPRTSESATFCNGVASGTCHLPAHWRTAGVIVGNETLDTPFTFGIVRMIVRNWISVCHLELELRHRVVDPHLLSHVGFRCLRSEGIADVKGLTPVSVLQVQHARVQLQPVSVSCWMGRHVIHEVMPSHPP